MLLQEDLTGNTCTEEVDPPCKQDTKPRQKQGRQLRCSQHQNKSVPARNRVHGPKQKGALQQTSCSPARRNKEGTPDPCAPTPTKRDALLSRFYLEHRQPEGQHKSSDTPRQSQRICAEQCTPGAGLVQSDGLPSLATYPRASLSTRAEDKTAMQHTSEPGSCPPNSTSCGSVPDVNWRDKQSMKGSSGEVPPPV